MSIFINACVFEKNHEKALSIAMALEKVNKILCKSAKEDDELDGVGAIMDCIVAHVYSLADEFEKLGYWAEDANVHIEYACNFGNQILIRNYARGKGGAA